MPEALQVRLNLLVCTILLLPLILTEEGGAGGAISISIEHKHSTNNNTYINIYRVYNNNEFYMSCTVTRADLQT